MEINTFLLIYRRNYGRNLLTEILFYSTWVCIRIVLFTTILTNYAFIFIIKDTNIYKLSIEIHDPIDIYTAIFFVISIVLMILNYYWTYDLLYKVFIDKSKTVSDRLWYNFCLNQQIIDDLLTNLTRSGGFALCERAVATCRVSMDCPRVVKVFE